MKNPMYKFTEKKKEKEKEKEKRAIVVSLFPPHLLISSKKSFGIWFPSLVFQKAGYDQLASSKADQFPGPFKKFHLQIKILICALLLISI